jgi:hypothetical protein
LLTAVHDAQSSDEDAGAGRSLLDEIVRDGARQMLAAALQAEVAAYIEQFTDQLDENGHRLVVRNWRWIATAREQDRPRRNWRQRPPPARGPRCADRTAP